MAVFDSQRALAARLIAKWGRKGVIVTQKTDASATNPATEAVTQTTRTETFTAVRLPHRRNVQFEAGTLQRYDGEEFYFDMKGHALVPRPGDTVVFGADTYTLVWTLQIAPDGNFPVFVQAHGER